MSSAAKSIEHMIVLNNMAKGLLNRLYYFKSGIIAKNQATCLFDADILKIRLKIEKKFPALPDTQKIPGWEAFINNAGSILKDLKEPYELFLDVSDFAVHAQQALKDITLNIVDFKMSRNRNLTLIYFDLLVSYIRVMKLLELVEERVAVAALYTAVYNTLPEIDKDLSTHKANKLKALLGECSDLPRHLIDLFAPSLVFVRPILLQLRDSLAAMENWEELRRGYALNPINEEALMAQPALKTLNEVTVVSLYTELQSLERYYEYAAFAFLAYPALLFQEPCLELLRLATTSRVVVSLHRDISLNIHLELERISLSFPQPSDSLMSVQLPKGTKLKNILKTVSRASVAGAGLRQKERRSFLETELGNLNRMVAAVPGLLGPKFPIVLAAAALARSELVAYFRHAEGVRLRKDSKAHYNPAQYYAEDVSGLLFELHTATVLIKKHRSIANTYYMQYLGGNDLKALQKLLAACGDGLDSVESYRDAILRDLEKVKTASASAGSALMEGQLEGFRMNWLRMSAVCSSQVMSQGVRAIGTSYDALTQRFLYVYDRSFYADSIDSLLDNYLDCREIQWFRSSFLAAFKTAMVDPHLHARHAWLFFAPLQRVRLSCHNECPEEVLQVCSRAGMVASSMLTELGTFVVTLVRFLWDQNSSLQAQYHPAETGRRAERFHQARLRGGATAANAAAAQETLPGSESEVWAKKQIENFVLIQRHLGWLMAGARECGVFAVHTLEYNPSLYLQEQIMQFFAEPMTELFEDNDASPLSFSHTLRKLTCGCLAVQQVLRLLQVDIATATQDLFFLEFQDNTQIPPPGLPVPSGASLDKEKLIYKVGQWFTELVGRIAHSGSGLVYCPDHRMFINATHSGVSSDFAVEAVLGHSELVALVTMVGVQGARAIEAQLLTVLVEQLRAVTGFIAENRNYLAQFEKNYCLILNAAVNVQKNDVVFDALRTIGVIIVIREMLHTALRDCFGVSFGDMQKALESAISSVELQCEPALTLSLACIAADMGLSTEDCDLSLTASLSKLDILQDKEVLFLLPNLAAALFASEKWERSQYLPRLEAFENNEHIIQLALIKLFDVFFTIAHTSLSAEARDPLDAMADDAGGPIGFAVGDAEEEQQEQNHHGKVCPRLAMRDRYKQYVARYVRIAAQTLLVQRENEGKIPHQRHTAQLPHRSMTVALEYFTVHCPAVERGTLERYLPNYLLHADLVDVSLGRQRTADHLRSFTHAAVVAPAADGPDQF